MKRIGTIPQEIQRISTLYLENRPKVKSQKPIKKKVAVRVGLMGLIVKAKRPFFY
jgi:hypothetical protein